MGFFNKWLGKEEEKQSKTQKVLFSPFITTTDHISRLLNETAKKYKLPPTALDFKIIQSKTYIRMDSKEEWTDVADDDWDKFDKPEILLSPDFEVRQVHEIEVIRYEEEPWSRDLILHIATNREKSRIVATFKEGSVIVDALHLLEKLQNLIQKKMAYAGMLVGLWDCDYLPFLEKVAAKAKVDGKYVFDEEEKVDIARCIASVPSVDDKLILLYKMKYEEKKGDRVDHSRRGFILAVEKDEPIIEYIKARKGTPGRNCMGVFIPVKEPQETQKPEFKVTDNIAVEEDENHIIYRAKRGGYVVYKDNTYDIQEEMDVKEVNFKTTGSIDAGVDTEVKINVTENDVMKDAIGTAVEVEATEVKVEGNVGASAVVHAEKVEIGGQTHQSSKIFAKSAVVNVHRGYLKVETKAVVTRVEGGKAEGRELAVSQMVGGEVKGLKVDVRIVGANARIVAASNITVGKILGENNKLIIDPSEIDFYREEIENLEAKIADLKEKAKKTETNLDERLAIAKKSESAVQILKQKIMEDRKKGIKPKPAFVEKIRQFQKLQDQIATLQKELASTRELLQMTQKSLLEYQEMTVNATIVNQGKWKDYTHIEFHLLQPPMTLEYTPRPDTGPQMVYLEAVGDEGYRIAVKSLKESDT